MLISRMSLTVYHDKVTMILGDSAIMTLVQDLSRSSRPNESAEARETFESKFERLLLHGPWKSYTYVCVDKHRERKRDGEGEESI